MTENLSQLNALELITAVINTGAFSYDELFFRATRIAKASVAFGTLRECLVRNQPHEAEGLPCSDIHYSSLRLQVLDCQERHEKQLSHSST